MNYQKTIERNNSKTINNHIIQIINWKSQLFQLIIYANTHQSFLQDPNRAQWGLGVSFFLVYDPLIFGPHLVSGVGEKLSLYISRMGRIPTRPTPRGILLSLFMAHIYIRKVSLISNDIHHNTLYHYISDKFKDMVEAIIYRMCVVIDISKLSVRALLQLYCFLF